MKKNKIKKKISREWVLLSIAAILLIVVLTIAVYSLNFLSDSILPVLSSGVDGEGVIKFNLEGFEELGL